MVTSYRSDDKGIFFRNRDVKNTDEISPHKSRISVGGGRAITPYKQICFILIKTRLSLLSGVKVVNSPFRYEAKNACLGLGGDLALIRDEVDYLRYRSVLQGISSSWRYWIGAKQRFWMWSSGKGKDEVDDLRYRGVLRTFRPPGCIAYEPKREQDKKESRDASNVVSPRLLIT